MLASITHLTGALPSPYFTAPSRTCVTSRSGLSDLFGVNPTSCISRNAAANVAASTTTLTTYGKPRLVTCARYPPATEPESIATPSTIDPLAKTESSRPVNPLAVSASTSQASTAPEKNVNPRPSSMETSAHAQKPAEMRHINK